VELGVVDCWSNGELSWSNGLMRKNRNRGYQKLIVWKDVINYYALTYDVFRSSPLSEVQFERLDSKADKLETGPLKLMESLERKPDRGGWIDHLVVKESNAVDEID